jgi:hypothetical protein
MGRRKKLFRLSFGDRGDIQRVIRPQDECFLREHRLEDDEDDEDAGRRARHPAGDVRFHAEAQDTECTAWQTMLELVDRTAKKERPVFWPASELEPEDMVRIIELPRSIAKLKSVTHLRLYGSHLVRIPPEIGEMSSLEDLDVYTSHRLHWFPYEITKCTRLRDSRVSTRSLYGNFKYRPPFPPIADIADLPIDTQGPCSVCGLALREGSIHLAWISLWVATDVLPLLVRACSRECIEQLPTPAEGYVQHPHSGGLSISQPPDYTTLVLRSRPESDS